MPQRTSGSVGGLACLAAKNGQTNTRTENKYRPTGSSRRVCLKMFPMEKQFTEQKHPDKTKENPEAGKPISAEDSKSKESEPEPEILDLSEDFLTVSGGNFSDKLYELKRTHRNKTKNELPKLAITVDCTSIDASRLENIAIRLKAFLENSDIIQFPKSAFMQLTKEQYKNARGAHNAFASGVKYKIVE